MDIEKCTENNELSSQPTESLPNITLETDKCMQEKELQPHLTSSMTSPSHCNDNDYNNSNGSDIEDSECLPRGSDSDSDDSETCDYPFRTFLAEWATKFNILHAALSDLLPIL